MTPNPQIIVISTILYMFSLNCYQIHEVLLYYHAKWQNSDINCSRVYVCTTNTYSMDSLGAMTHTMVSVFVSMPQH